MNNITFGQTLAAKRKEKRMSQTHLAGLLKFRGFDVKANSISKWEQNVNTPSVLQFFALCEILEIDDINTTFGIAIEENLFAQLNDEGQKKAIEYMQLLIKSGMYIREEQIHISNQRDIDVYLEPVSAGTGQYLDSSNATKMEVGDEVSSLADFGVRVAGDSMEPRYLNGQIIWIHKQDTLEEGEIGIFFLDGESYVKKIHFAEDHVELISLNKKYNPIVVAPHAEFKVFGKVVG